MAYYIHPV